MQFFRSQQSPDYCTVCQRLLLALLGGRPHLHPRYAHRQPDLMNAAECFVGPSPLVTQNIPPQLCPKVFLSAAAGFTFTYRRQACWLCRKLWGVGGLGCFWVLVVGYKLFKADWVCSARWQVDPPTPSGGLWASQRRHKVVFFRCLRDVLGAVCGSGGDLLPAQREDCGLVCSCTAVCFRSCH